MNPSLSDARRSTMMRAVARAVSRRSNRASFARAYARETHVSESAVAEANASLDASFGRAAFSTTTPTTSGDDERDAANARLTHVDPVTGAASMVNVGAKPSTSRTATASARVTLGREAYEAVKRNGIQKGDVLATARLAGIMGAKKTHDLIPLCHQISLDGVTIDLRMVDDDAAVEVFATASCAGKTGVEMEALTAAAVSGLTIYDMCKAVSKDIVIDRVRLESKIGGKSGEWRRSSSGA